MNALRVFLKGFLMGTADIIPGISGGTIAFITGIYFRFIKSVKNINIKNIADLIKLFYELDFKGLSKKFKDLDFHFLATLLIGILLAVFGVSKFISYLLENYASYTLAFFVGLIAASAKIIFDEIKSHKISDIVFGAIGFIIGITMLFLVPTDITEPALWYVFLGGFVAISAMFLPGISGSFILLVLGLYHFVLESIHNLSNRLTYIIVFGIGLILGALSISRLISFSYEKSKSKTLYVLLGIVLGALAIPIRESILSLPITNTISYLILLGFAIEGILVVKLIDILSKN